MKRFWALILTLALVLQVAMAGVAFSEETPTVTLTYVDSEGNTKEVVLEERNGYTDDANGVRAYNGLPETGIDAEVYGENDTTIALLVDGAIMLVDKEYYYGALSIGNQTDATVAGGIETEGDAISVYGDDSSVDVQGDVKAGQERELSDGTKDGYGTGVDVRGDSFVSISGSLTTQGQAIEINNKTLDNTTTTENADGTKTYTYEGESIATEAGVFVAGDVTSNYDRGIKAGGESEVTIGGSLTSKDNAIEARGNSTIAVAGDVTSTNGNGIYTQQEAGAWKSTWTEDASGEIVPGSSKYEGSDYRDEATVTVGGNVTAYENGVVATGGSTVDITGDVTAGHIEESTYSSYGSGNGVVAYDESTVLVGGGITSKATGVNATSTSSNFDKDAVNQATVIVGGDIDAYNNGINAGGEAFVSVAGDVTAGHIQEEKYPDGESYSYSTGYGISAKASSTVLVGGNVTSESIGIYAAEGGTSKSEELDPVKNADGTITYGTKRTYVPNQSTVVVEGNVTSNGSSGIYAAGEATVAVGGDVVSEESVAISTDKQTISSTSTRTTKVDENGNQIYDEYGYPVYEYDYEEEKSESAGNVTVDGNVKAKKNAAIRMQGDSNVTVWGDVTGGYVPEEVESEPDDEPGEEYEPSAQEIAYWDAIAEAFKDVDFASELDGAVEISLAEKSNEGQLIVGGTVSTYEDNVPIVLTYSVDDESKLATMPELPEMKIYEIVPEGGEYFDVNVVLQKKFDYSYVDEETGKTVEVKDASYSGYVELSEEDHKAVVEAIAKSIQYIIKLNGEHASFTLDGAAYDAENDIYTAHEEEDVKVTVRPDEGYGLDGLTASGNYTLTDNGDGTWTLIIHRGGGVTLTATISERTISAPTTTNEEVKNTPPAFTHPALGKVVKFGHYDFDNDGTAGELEWKIIGVSNGYAQLALISLVDGVPEDFMEKAFDDTEKEALKEGETVFALSAETAKRFFQDPAGTEQVHLSIPVALTALVY